MKMIAVKCPSCSGDLQIEMGQQLVDCTYCESRVFVRWDDDAQPHLSKIESDLAWMKPMVTVTAADTRLKYIDEDIDQARQSVVARDRDRVTALNAQASLRQRVRTAFLTRLIYAVGAAAFGLFLWLFTVFNLDWPGWWVTLLVALGLTYAAWYYGSEWRELVAQAPGQLQAAQGRVDEASTSLREAQAQLAQLESEKARCERDVREYRHTGGAQA